MFTPGPWKYASVYVNNGPNQHHVTTGKWGHPSIAVCENEYDARLIAAAPEMYKELQRCAEIFDHNGEGLQAMVIRELLSKIEDN